jgi:uncharacterized protein (TIGR02594 family)
MAFGLVAAPAILRNVPLAAQETASGDVMEDFDQLIYPPFGAIGAPEKFGYTKPSKEQIERVAKIINETPEGPHPLAIARSFTQRFTDKEPRVISQWPAPDAWNPLIVEFFKSTSTPANNDMVAWCAAFANWCIERNRKTGTRSAASQSFVDPKNAKWFKKISDPEPGDLAVWTCYEIPSGKNLGLGHVAFVTGKPGADSVPTISGNVSDDNHSSIIVEKPFPTRDRVVRRTVNGKRVPATMKLNSYVRMA